MSRSSAWNSRSVRVGARKASSRSRCTGSTACIAAFSGRWTYKFSTRIWACRTSSIRSAAESAGWSSAKSRNCARVRTAPSPCPRDRDESRPMAARYVPARRGAGIGSGYGREVSRTAPSRRAGPDPLARAGPGERADTAGSGLGDLDADREVVGVAVLVDRAAHPAVRPGLGIAAGAGGAGEPEDLGGVRLHPDRRVRAGHVGVGEELVELVGLVVEVERAVRDAR